MLHSSGTLNLQAFSREVSAARARMGLSVEELSERLSQPASLLLRLEAQDWVPDGFYLRALCKELHLQVPELLDESFKTKINNDNSGARESKDTASALLGKVLQGYEFLEQIGEGGFGSVFRARQMSVGRDVAIKVIRADLADDVDFIRRFEAEAELVARLEHPHIVPLYDYWREPGAAYMVMRLLKGGSLSQVLKQETPAGRLPGVLPLLLQVAQALHTAHLAGVVHRDLKPANILLDGIGNVCLADFGIAKQTLLEESVQTTSGEIIGSIAYCAPEQLRADRVSPQTDVYALALLSYELLCGRRPFLGGSAAALMQQHLNDLPPKASDFKQDLPRAVDAVLAKALSKDAKQRHVSTLAFFAELDACFRGVQVSWLTGASLPIGDQNTLTQSQIELSETENPYRGLASFDEGDARNFFGRESLIAQLLDSLHNQHPLHRALVVSGPSGSGKSSVVRAGLIPALKADALPQSDRWIYTTTVPGSDPFQNLANAIQRVSVRADIDVLELLKSDVAGLSRAIDRCLPNEASCELFLLIDQFEELFTLCHDDAVRKAWMNALTHALLEKSSRLRVVFTMRADFLDRPLQYPDLADIMRYRVVLVPMLNLEELERAITGPARRIGLFFEDRLVAAMLDEVSAQSGALPLLQYALSELFQKRSGNMLTLKSFQEMGGVRGALAGRAEAAYSGLNEAEKDAARQLMLRLTTLGEGREDTRRRVYQKELDALREEVGKDAYDVALAAFTHARLLTFDRDPGGFENTLEVAHEALLRNWQKLQEWLQASRADLRLQRQLSGTVQAWREAKQDQSFLLSDMRLAQFAPLLQQKGVKLTTEESSFLSASLKREEQLTALENERAARELQQAQALAEQQQRAAEAKARANGRLRWLVLGLAGILVFALWQTYQISERSRALAIQTKSARSLSSFWEKLFANADPDAGQGKELTVREMLNQGLSQVQSELKDTPEVQARLLLSMATSYRQLSQFEQAQTAITAAESAIASLSVAPLDLKHSIGLEHGRILADLRQSDAALQILQATLESQRNSSDDPLAIGTTINVLATVYSDKQNFAKAQELLQEALSLREKNGAPQAELASTLSNLAFAAGQLGKLREAKAAFAKALDYRIKAHGELHSEVGVVQLNLTRNCLDLGDTDSAKKYAAEADKTLRTIYAQDPTRLDLSEHPTIAFLLLQQARLENLKGNYPAALSYFEQSLAMNAKIFGADHVSLVRVYRAQLQAALGAKDWTLAAEVIETLATSKEPVIQYISLVAGAEIAAKDNRWDEVKRLLETAAQSIYKPDASEFEIRALMLMARIEPARAAEFKARADAIVNSPKNIELAVLRRFLTN
jgi:serine/threonine protein kinase/tetratricopeptide (TPR) repeat protein